MKGRNGFGGGGGDTNFSWGDATSEHQLGFVWGGVGRGGVG